MAIVRYTYPNTARYVVPALGLFGRSPWTGLENEIGRFFQGASADGSGAAGSFPVEVYDDKESTFVRAELPGVAREDISLELLEGTLTIKATRRQKTGEKEQSFEFERALAVPERVSADKVTAAYENGVLTVTLPKPEEVKPQKITVAVK
jgi:HSP20 family protein